jgi:Winged helix-turn helix
LFSVDVFVVGIGAGGSKSSLGPSLCPYSDGVLDAEDETKAAYWTLSALAEAAREIGIEISRSQVRRILLREGVRWRNTRPWAQGSDAEYVPKGLMDRRTLHRDPPPNSTAACVDNRDLRGLQVAGQLKAP